MIAHVPRRVWSGTGLLVLGRLFGSACTLATLFLLAQRLAGDGFGRFTFYLALFMVLDSFVDLGTGQVLVQRTADDPQAVAPMLGAARRIRLATGLFGVLVVGSGAFLAGEPGAVWILVASLYPLTHVLELSTIVFKNRIAWAKPVVVRAVASGASLAFVVAFLAAGVRAPELFLVAIAMGSAIGNLLLHLASRSHLPRRVGPVAPLRPFLRNALPIGLAGLCQQTYFYIDNLFVRGIEGATAVGHYNVAVRIMSFGIMVAVFAPLAALPWLTREHAAGRLGVAAARLAQPLFALAGLALGLLWGFCEPLLALFGAGFAAAGDTLRWLLLACLAVYVGATFLTAVVASGRARGVLGVAAAGLAVNLIGNSALVPRMGIEGAAAATLATEIAVVLGAAMVLARVGAHPLRSRPWAWLGGPALFLLGATVSSALSAS